MVSLLYHMMCSSVATSSTPSYSLLLPHILDVCPCVVCVCPACVLRVLRSALLRPAQRQARERKMNRSEIVKNILTSNLQACDPKIDEYLKLLSEHGADLCWYVHLFLSSLSFMFILHIHLIIKLSFNIKSFIIIFNTFKILISNTGTSIVPSSNISIKCGRY